MGKLHIVPFFILDGGEGHIHIVEHGETVVRGLSGIAELGEELFLFGIKGMGTGTGDVIDHVAVGGKAVCFHEGSKGIRRDGQHFRNEPGSGGVEVDKQGHAARFHGLRFAVAVVTRLVEHGVKVGELQLFGKAIDGAEGFFHLRRTFAEGAPEIRKGGDVRFHLFKGSFPCFLGGENVGKIPHEGSVHVFTVFEFHGCR